jgi:beta-phosphoglucomutase-like phosphatase (HAD superfamily)
MATVVHGHRRQLLCGSGCDRHHRAVEAVVTATTVLDYVEAVVTATTVLELPRPPTCVNWPAQNRKQQTKKKVLIVS